MALVKELEHLKISLDAINLATNSFGVENFIGVGGFGKVYKGEITDKKGLTQTVAIKRLDRKHGQGEHEFLTEIMMLSRYRHKNLVSLLGFCDEGEEKILVYEYEFNGSLEKYLSSNDLTWVQRLKICIGAARGLEYLHNPFGTQQRVLHRDVKSSNVLLDHFWEAKISDFGLSKIGPANQEFTFLVSTVVGTLGYCDPLYAETGILTKESDVYSFGVVLFEVLCGRLCIGNRDDDPNRLLARLAQRCYEKGTLEDIIFNGLREQMEPKSLEAFSSIAYQCLRREREERPTMADVLAELEQAFEYQENHESGKPMEYEEIIQMADSEHPLVYTNKKELKLLLSSGVLIDWGKRWFSLSKNELNCEMISASEFSFKGSESVEWVPHPKSRFLEVAKIEDSHDMNIEVDIETFFLSPGITYAAYLVFKYCNTSYFQEPEMSSQPIFVGLKYKLKEAEESSRSHLADHTNDGWMLIELCQFLTCKKVTKLEVSLYSFFGYTSVLLEGIQFLPVEQAIIDESIQVENLHTNPTNGEHKLPSDYRHIIKMAKDPVPYKITHRELYLLLSNGILINKGQAFFYLNQDGLKCCLQAASAVVKYHESLETFHWISVRESRFEKVAVCQSGYEFRINCNTNSHMLSPNTTYAIYLVYKLPKDIHGVFECPLEVKKFHRYPENETKLFLLTSPKTPVIGQGHGKNLLNRPKIDEIPQERKDGWMEAQIWSFITDAAPSSINKELEVSLCDYQEKLTGLIVEGIEIRPK
uniref:uncharacterized protein LOC122578857 n=1 Tax=Erigeron canadensis TaxID=72917 RepID=UPI001CB98BEB|nr:uncharacterized protein LOC122578857 [Erigeron canadensis]